MYMYYIQCRVYTTRIFSQPYYIAVYIIFADDIALLAQTEQDLQTLLDFLYTWYNTWLLHINTSKSKVVHFRPKSQALILSVALLP